MSNLNALSKRVEDNNGVLSMTMWQLRDACGFDRLGSNVVKSISEKLSIKGLRCFPRELTMNRDDLVRIYDPRTPAGLLVAAVLKPGNANDEKIVSVSANSATVTLAKIREILEESDS